MFLSLAFLLSAVNGALVFFVHMPVNARLRPRTYFQAYGAAELLLAGIGLVLAALVAFLLYRQAENDQRKAGRTAWSVSIAALVLGILGLLAIPNTCSLWGSSSLDLVSVSLPDSPAYRGLISRHCRGQRPLLAEAPAQK